MVSICRVEPPQRNSDLNRKELSSINNIFLIFLKLPKVNDYFNTKFKYIIEIKLLNGLQYFLHLLYEIRKAINEQKTNATNYFFFMENIVLFMEKYNFVDNCYVQYITVNAKQKVHFYPQQAQHPDRYIHFLYYRRLRCGRRQERVRI